MYGAQHSNLHNLYCSTIPESPRWLLVRKKYKQARAVLARIGKGNGRPLPDSLDCADFKVVWICYMLDDKVMCDWCKITLDIWYWFIFSTDLKGK